MSQRCWALLTQLQWCSFNVSRSCYILLLELFGLRGMHSKSGLGTNHTLSSTSSALSVVPAIIAYCIAVAC